MERETGTHMERLIEGERQTDKETKIQTERQIVRQTDS